MDDARGGGVAGTGFVGDDPAAPAVAGPRASVPPPGYLGHRARLRQRLVDGGPTALLDHELLDFVLFLALPRRDTRTIADALVRRYGGFADAVAAPAAELGAVAGLGQAGVAALKAVEAAALRVSEPAAAERRPVLDGWDGLVGYLAAAPSREKTERVRVLFLDARDRLLSDEAQGHGAADPAPLRPREVVRRALEVGATALVLVRNHPDGDPAPSQADVEAAERVKAAAGAFGIALRDHLVVGRGPCASLRRSGLL